MFWVNCSVIVGKINENLICKNCYPAFVVHMTFNDILSCVWCPMEFPLPILFDRF